MTIRPVSLDRLSSYPISAEVASPLPVRGTYDHRARRYWMIDPSDPAVVAIDPRGNERARWGRKGSGPGDLFLLPWYRPGYNVAVLGGELLVFDMYRLSLFDQEGHFLDLVAVAENPLGLIPGASILSLSDSSVLLGVVQSRLAQDTATAALTAVRYYRVRIGGSKLRLDTLPYTLVSKVRYAGGFKPSRIPFYNSFVFEMGETWTISGGALYGVGYSGFGICELDPVSGVLQGVVRIKADRRRTTDAERLALHAQSPGMDETNPDGSNFGAEMDAHWPATTPWYMHLVGGDSLNAAARSLSRTEDAVDLYSGLSYLGSAPVPRGWLRGVIAISGDSLLRLERDTMNDELSLTWYRARSFQ